MSTPLVRYLTAGAATVGLYVGGVWFGTEILNLPARPVNAFFYVTATAISFALNYMWVFRATVNVKGAIINFLLLQGFGVIFNLSWVEVGLRFTPFYPWIIAATYFAIWPFLSFTIQKRFIFNR